MRDDPSDPALSSFQICSLLKTLMLSMIQLFGQWWWSSVVHEQHWSYCPRRSVYRSQQL